MTTNYLIIKSVCSYVILVQLIICNSFLSKPISKDTYVIANCVTISDFREEVKIWVNRMEETDTFKVPDAVKLVKVHNTITKHGFDYTEVDSVYYNFESLIAIKSFILYRTLECTSLRRDGYFESPKYNIIYGSTEPEHTLEICDVVNRK
jgi:hypothetical protein